MAVAIMDQKAPSYIGRSATHGLQVRQPKGTGNWFYFPIPTPLEVDNEPMNYGWADFEYVINAGARITAVNVSARNPMGKDPSMKLLLETPCSISNRGLSRYDIHNLPNEHVSGAVTIGVKVEFFGSNPEGSIQLSGARMQFDR